MLFKRETEEIKGNPKRENQSKVLTLNKTVNICVDKSIVVTLKCFFIVQRRKKRHYFFSPALFSTKLHINRAAHFIWFSWTLTITSDTRFVFEISVKFDSNCLKFFLFLLVKKSLIEIIVRLQFRQRTPNASVTKIKFNKFKFGRRLKHTQRKKTWRVPYFIWLHYTWLWSVRMAKCWK